ncbi:metabotropic glutamate receptor-like [Ooceraea biroi]|uniref:metabotropic glutamate receptor-like n=1 Tax=Ooceraea biroi TaxID=2015173 RepID=UPI000F07A193|nr:metabotropic glutamate receptor-like [Ooceraea biroi]
MVHEREDTVTCGPVMPQGGVQALEAMLYTLDILNEREIVRRQDRAHILDDCDKDTYGLEMAVDFIKGRTSTSTCAILTLRASAPVRYSRRSEKSLAGSEGLTWRSGRLRVNNMELELEEYQMELEDSEGREPT